MSSLSWAGRRRRRRRRGRVRPERLLVLGNHVVPALPPLGRVCLELVVAMRQRRRALAKNGTRESKPFSMADLIETEDELRPESTRCRAAGVIGPWSHQLFA